MLTTPKVSIIIPAYNEESFLVSQLDILLRGVRSVLTEFEVLVVENGSKDRTRLLLKEYSRSAPEIKPVCLEVPDIGGALREGIIQAKAEIIHICAMDYFDLNFFRDTLMRPSFFVRMLYCSIRLQPK